jgi:hypothetical protein
MARELIYGRIRTYAERDEDILGGTGTISELLESNGISPEVVCDLISEPRSDINGLDTFAEGKQSFFSSKDHLHQMIHGPVDADQMDYLLRDAHYTGVAHGSIDIERLLTQMKVHNNKMVLERGGVVAAEGLMVSRALMYTSVYFNKTVRIAEMMLSKAAELSDLDMRTLHLKDDQDLRNELIEQGGKPSKLMRMLNNRMLYKKAYSAYSIDLSEDQMSTILRYSGYKDKKRLEDEIAETAGVDYSEVIVDMPSRSSLLSNARIGKTDVLILYEGRVRPITKLSPVSKALQSRDIFDWAIMVSAPPELKEKVGKAADSILNL